MPDAATTTPPQDRRALIDHVVTTSHASHRAGSPVMVPWAERIEHDHAGKPYAQRGISHVLIRFVRNREDHMANAQTILSPAMRAGAAAAHVAPENHVRFAQIDPAS